MFVIPRATIKIKLKRSIVVLTILLLRSLLQQQMKLVAQGLHVPTGVIHIVQQKLHTHHFPGRGGRGRKGLLCSKNGAPQLLKEEIQRKYILHRGHFAVRIGKHITLCVRCSVESAAVKVCVQYTCHTFCSIGGSGSGTGNGGGGRW